MRVPYGRYRTDRPYVLPLSSSFTFCHEFIPAVLTYPGCRAGDRTEEVHLSASERANFPVGRSPKAPRVPWDGLYDVGVKGEPTW